MPIPRLMVAAARALRETELPFRKASEGSVPAAPGVTRTLDRDVRRVARRTRRRDKRRHRRQRLRRTSSSAPVDDVLELARPTPELLTRRNQRRRRRRRSRRAGTNPGGASRLVHPVTGHTTNAAGRRARTTPGKRSATGSPRARRRLIARATTGSSYRTCPTARPRSPDPCASWRTGTSRPAR